MVFLASFIPCLNDLEIEGRGINTVRDWAEDEKKGRMYLNIFNEEEIPFQVFQLGKLLQIKKKNHSDLNILGKRN